MDLNAHLNFKCTYVLLAGLSSRGADGGFKSFYTGSLSRFVYSHLQLLFKTKANTQ